MGESAETVDGRIDQLMNGTGQAEWRADRRVERGKRLDRRAKGQMWARVGGDAGGGGSGAVVGVDCAL